MPPQGPIATVRLPAEKFYPSVMRPVPMPLQKLYAWLTEQLAPDASDALNPMSAPAAVATGVAKGIAKPAFHKFVREAMDALPPSVKRLWDRYTEESSGSLEVRKYLDDYVNAVKQHPEYQRLFRQMAEPVLQADPPMYRTIRMRTPQQTALGPMSQIGPRGFTADRNTAAFFANGEYPSILMEGRMTPESLLAPGLPIEYELILDPSKMRNMATGLVHSPPASLLEGLPTGLPPVKPTPAPKSWEQHLLDQMLGRNR